MILQAKLERRQQSSKAHEGSHSSMLDSIDNTMTGHPQSIPPPSEPVLPIANKVISSKCADSMTSTQLAFQAGETVTEHRDVHTQSPPWFTGDKSEAKDSSTVHKGELYCVLLTHCHILKHPIDKRKTKLIYRRIKY